MENFEIGDVVKREVIGAVVLPLGRSVNGSAFGDDRGRLITIVTSRDGVVTNSDDVWCLLPG